ncbi:MAG TPA: ATP synthase F1 subunit gamma, partial [Polyangia bacterium]
MPSLKKIRTRIASVKNTQKITRAMKLVAAARLRRAQDNIIALRPYATRLRRVIAEVAARADVRAHPLLARRKPRRAGLVVLTSDRGLCGGFNANINRRTERWFREHKAELEEIRLTVIGRKGRDYLKRRNYEIAREYTGVLGPRSLEAAQEIGRIVVGDYGRRNLDAVYLVYNEFKNAAQQRIVVEQILPVEPIELEDDDGGFDFKYEPGRKELLDRLLPQSIETEIYRAILESIASEFGARMTAMENATTNASEMISRLTLEFNRARQAAI